MILKSSGQHFVLLTYSNRFHMFCPEIEWSSGILEQQRPKTVKNAEFVCCVSESECAHEKQHMVDSNAHHIKIET